MDMRRYIERKDEFDEVDDLPSLKGKTGAQKVAASHHGSDAGANESTIETPVTAIFVIFMYCKGFYSQL